MSPSVSSASPHDFGLGSYRARAVRAIDGDTLELCVDVGFRLHIQPLRVRIWGVDCDEMHDADQGKRARAERAKLFATEFVTGDGEWPLRLVTMKPDPDSFGRWLGDVSRQDTTGPFGQATLAEELLRRGLAVAYRRS